MKAAENIPWSREEFEAQLRAKGARYHIHHPFHIAMNSGQCTQAQVQGWVVNRFYYQISIPVKDAAILANMPEREHRRQWIQRILDHDGTRGDEGGIEAWLRLGEAVGLERAAVTSLDRVLPGVRFAVDAYVNFARRAPWQEAVCSSLTELFAPEIHKERLANWPQHYPWIDAAGYAYFRQRLTEARRDVEHGLRVTLEHFRTRAEQERALEILQFKLDILWSMLDAMQLAYGIGDKRGRVVMAFGDDTVPQLDRRYRFQYEAVQQAYVLLYPEGMVKLGASAGEILKRVDGNASVADIVADLERAFPGADLRADVSAFFAHAEEKGWLHAKQP